MIYRYMIPVYGLLVQSGSMTVDKNDEGGRELVPEEYIQLVCEWLKLNNITNE